MKKFTYILKYCNHFITFFVEKNKIYLVNKVIFTIFVKQMVDMLV